MTIKDLADLGTMLAAILAAGVSLASFLRVRNVDAKVTKIEEHSNGMRAALEKSAYDRGASDEKSGDAKTKAEAP